MSKKRRGYVERRVEASVVFMIGVIVLGGGMWLVAWVLEWWLG